MCGSARVIKGLHQMLVVILARSSVRTCSNIETARFLSEDNQTVIKLNLVLSLKAFAPFVFRSVSARSGGHFYSLRIQAARVMAPVRVL